jgi:hypothetical protein
MPTNETTRTPATTPAATTDAQRSFPTDSASRGEARGMARMNSGAPEATAYRSQADGEG